MHRSRSDVWPPLECEGCEILFVDQNTVIFRNELERPFDDPPKNFPPDAHDEIIAFDRVGFTISAIASIVPQGLIFGKIAFGLGRQIDAASYGEMSLQVEGFIEGFGG